MLFVIYNSNPHNKPELPTIRGWSLYSKEDWWALCHNVDHYFYIIPEGDAEISNETIFYYSYEEWLADYQVAEVDMNKFIGGYHLIDVLLGTNFFVPELSTILDDDAIYPEMDAYA